MSTTSGDEFSNAPEPSLALRRAQALTLRASVQSQIQIDDSELKDRLAHTVEDSAKLWSNPPTDVQVNFAIDQCWSDIEFLYRASVLAATEEDALRRLRRTRRWWAGIAWPVAGTCLIWITVLFVNLFGTTHLSGVVIAVQLIVVGLVGISTVFLLLRWRSQLIIYREALRLCSEERLSIDSRLPDLLEAVLYTPIRASTAPQTTTDPSLDRVVFRPDAYPSSKEQSEEFVTSKAARRVAIALARRDGATIGLSGPRGIGKTTIARHYTDESYGPYGIMISAPVAYDVPLFLQQVLKELCLRVLGQQHSIEVLRRAKLVQTRQRILVAFLLGLGLLVIAVAQILIGQRKPDIYHALIRFGILPAIGGIALLAYAAWLIVPRARRLRGSNRLVIYASELLRRIDYTETLTLGGSIAASIQGVGISRSQSRQISRRTLTDVDVPRELGLLVQLISHPVVIAIDELDKMSSDKKAVSFINRIKPLFVIPGCSFIVSVSENVWTRFANRGFPLRDAFDSSFDEIVRLELLTPLESRDILRSRDPLISDLQCLACHCLSGGLPRELLRFARELGSTGI